VMRAKHIIGHYEGAKTFLIPKCPERSDVWKIIKGQKCAKNIYRNLQKMKLQAFLISSFNKT
jgi:hypothetical protein